jgi:riboflavin transporter FmnP
VKKQMNTKKLSLIIIFTALTAAITLVGPKFPAPYAPYLQYQLWEIPLVVAFFAIGQKEGIFIAAINSFVLLAIDPGPLPAGPFYNLAAVLSMLLGVYIPYKLSTRSFKTGDLAQKLRQNLKIVIISGTALGILLRVALMSIVNFVPLPQDYPFGFHKTQPVALAALPFIGVFNASVALYTVPVGLGIALVILSRFDMSLFSSKKGKF